MSFPLVLIVGLLIFATAVLYSSVGHAGATAYIAVLTLFGAEPEIIKPTALLLNLFVAGLTTARFIRAGRVQWRLLWPFATTSVPCAFLGGAVMLPKTSYELLLGTLLILAGARMMFPGAQSFIGGRSPPPVLPALIAGAAIGLTAGLTGIGGGVLLSPLLLFARRADPRQAAGVSAPFILVNSAAGLLGHQLTASYIPPEAAYWLPAALAGATIGSGLGATRLSNVWLLRIMAMVILIAAVRMLLF